MASDRSNTWRDVLIFLLLVGLGVAGRWAQPQWAFTPLAAATVFAGYYFSRPVVAMMVPIAILAVSDLLLPAYDSIPVMLVTYAVMMVPALLGRVLRGKTSIIGNIARWGICGFLPATLFFLTTNLAVWVFQSDYEKTWAGLMQCYWAAVPFYRWMLAGDVFYLAVVFGCFAMAGGKLPQTVPATAPIKDRS